MLKVLRVDSPAQWRRFHYLPGFIYQRDPLWTPLPIDNQKQMFNPQMNPILRHVQYECFIAVRGQETLGRIIATTDDLLADQRVGLFGGFECINNSDVARGLIETAAESLSKRGKSIIQGPAMMNTSQQVGLLVEGFKRPPQLMMPYNPPYYAELLESNGFCPLLDLQSYRWKKDDPVNYHKLFAVATRAAKIQGIRIRSFNLNDPWGEGKRLAKLHNETMTKQWGFVPMDQEEAAHYLSGIRSYTDPEMLFFCEVDNIPIGVCLMIPDLGPQIRATKRIGFPVALPFLGPRSIRVGVLGVIPEYRRRGVVALLIKRAKQVLHRKGYQQAELSLIMDLNMEMNRIITTAVGSTVYKKFRVYEKNLNP